MSQQQLSEEAIFEVAREIQSPRVRSKYLKQVCHDERLLGRLEGRLASVGRRWQFSLRSLLIVMLLGGVVSAGMAATALQLARARRAEAVARMRALEAQKMAELARAQAESALRESAEMSSAEGGPR